MIPGWKALALAVTTAASMTILSLVSAALTSAVAQPAAAPSAGAQPAGDEDADKLLEKYRAMISDPMSNPGYLAVDSGEALWTTARGPKNATLETCDLGKGPGKLDGAYAEMPRWFADAGRVMDAESRLLWCMETIQGLDTTALRKKPFASSGGNPATEIEALVAFVANKSNGFKYAAKMEHPKEREAVALGCPSSRHLAQIGAWISGVRASSGV